MVGLCGRDALGYVVQAMNFRYKTLGPLKLYVAMEYPDSSPPEPRTAPLADWEAHSIIVGYAVASTLARWAIGTL